MSWVCLPNVTNYANLSLLFIGAGEALKRLCPAEMHLFFFLFALLSQRLRHVGNASVTSRHNGDASGDSD